MPARVFAPDAETAGQVLALSRDEAAHVGKVLRLGRGDALRVFDGRGREWEATITASTATTVSIALGGTVAAAPEPRVRYTLALAVLKGDGTDEAIRDAVMMGVARVRPMVSARAETRLAALARGERQQRWQRVAVASAKQCGRAVVPVIEAAAAAGTVFDDAEDPLRLILVEPTLAAGGAPAAIHGLPAPAAVTLAVGPEGGWTAEEVAAARARGWTPVRLGARTLRASAMALVALAACQAVWADA